MAINPYNGHKTKQWGNNIYGDPYESVLYREAVQPQREGILKEKKEEGRWPVLRM